MSDADENQKDDGFAGVKAGTAFDIVTYPDGTTAKVVRTQENPQGRPSMFNPDYHPQKAMELAQEGFSFTMIASVFGITRKTLYEWMKKHDDVMDRAKLYRARRTHLEAIALDHFRGNVKNPSVLRVLANLTDYDAEAEEGSEYGHSDDRQATEQTDRLAIIAEKLREQAGVLNLRASKDGQD